MSYSDHLLEPPSVPLGLESVKVFPEIQRVGARGQAFQVLGHGDGDHVAIEEFRSFQEWNKRTTSMTIVQVLEGHSPAVHEKTAANLPAPGWPLR